MNNRFFRLESSIAAARDLLVATKLHVDTHPNDRWLREMETRLADLVDGLTYSAELFAEQAV